MMQWMTNIWKTGIMKDVYKRQARDCFVKTVLQLFNCFTVIAKTHPESPFAMDFGNPESLSYGQRKALACAAECAGLFEQ